MKKCPVCLKEIQDEVVKCQHCGSEINNSPSKSLDFGSELLLKANRINIPKTSFEKYRLAWIIGAVFIVIVFSSILSPHHYMDTFIPDGNTIVFALSHKYIPGTLKVYLSAPGWPRDLTTLGKGGVDEGSDGQSVIVKGVDLECVHRNPYDWRSCPEAPYSSEWKIEAEYDSKN